MLNQISIDTNQSQTKSPSLVKPDYSKYCFANIPGSIFHTFNIDSPTHLPSDVIPDATGIENVIFILIDAFGWNLFQKFADSSSLLQTFIKKGIVSQLTSQFPSTTTAHITTAQTNQTVGEHGMYEWHYYEPSIDAMFTPLLFSYSGDKVGGTLLPAKINPAQLYPSSSIYQAFNSSGVSSHVFAFKDYVSSPYHQIITKDASHHHIFSTLDQGLSQLSQTVSSSLGPSVFYLYWGMLDAISHQYGPNSDQTTQELTNILDSMETNLLNISKSSQNKTLLLIGADHGHDQVDPPSTIYLNQLIPQISNVIQTTKSGKLKTPAGSPRDYFLYIKDDHLESTHALLNQKLAGKAQIKRVDQLIKQGYFGPSVSEKFLSRIGNLVILPNSGEMVWWFEKNKFEQKFLGHHGGLSTNEMLTPFLAITI